MNVQLNNQSQSRRTTPNSVISAIVTIGMIAVIYGVLTGYFETDSLSKEKFESVKIGMTLEEVQTIAGEKGSVTFEGAGGITYAFKGKGSIGANGSFTFNEGKLTNKAQLGLK